MSERAGGYVANTKGRLWTQEDYDEDRRLAKAREAAEPDLLQACKSCLIGLESGKGSIPFMITMLRAALRKAEGKT